MTLCSSSCLAIFFKTLGCAVQAVAPRARICDSPSVKVRQILRAPCLIPVIHVLNSPSYEGFRTISTEFSPVVHFANDQLTDPKLCIEPTLSTKPRQAQRSRVNSLIWV